MDYSINGLKLEAMKREYIQTCQNILRKGTYEYFNNVDNGLLNELQNAHSLEYSVREKLSRKPPFRMITLNFDNEKDAESLFSDMTELMQKKWIAQYWCSLEYYSAEGVYSHPHIHCFIRLGNLMKKKSEIIRELHGTLRTKYDIQLLPQYIDVKEHKEKENGYNYVARKSHKKKAKGTKMDLKRLLRHKMPTLVTSDLEWFDPTIADDCAIQAQRLLE